MRITLLFIAILFLSASLLLGQQPGQKISSKSAQASIPTKQNSSRTLSENCNNGIDDNGNGLIDCEDYSCYYSGNIVCNCAPIDVIWIGDNDGDLYWINHVTGVETYVGPMGRPMTDITWSPDGNLYGVDYIENKIWKIDPATAQITFVSEISGYDFSNALTADGIGNLFLASRLAFAGNTYHIIKLDLSTGLTTVVTDLSGTGWLSAGDLAFYNGTLYLACINNLLAQIDITTGGVGSNPILGLPTGANIFGIVVKSDGTIYLSDINKLYKLNITTMQASLYYTCSTPGIYIWGMANFNDYCLSPSCRAKVNISVESNQPYCSDAGVKLKANGTGLNGTQKYLWTLPDATVVDGQTITVTKSGTYLVRYSTIPDTCAKEDFIDIQLTRTPRAKLGADTVLCTGTTITFSPTDTAAVTSYLWQNGSTTSQLLINQPGLYWVEAGNVCGTSRDSVVVNEITFSNVDIGPDREVCEYDTLHIQNLLDRADYTYTWSDNTSGKFMVVPAPGKYWVDVGSACGKISDTIIIRKKIDDCECSLYIPTAFTPNKDGKNELLKTFSNCHVTGELSIYNRWGQLMYQTKDLQKGWNGIYNSTPQSIGVYVYQVKYAYAFRPGTFYKKGTFVLIR